MKSWLCMIVILAAATCAHATPTPPSDPRALQIMRQAKAAAGGSRLDKLTTFYSGGTRVRDGKTDGVYQEWGDYRTMAYTNIETFDAVTASGGFDGRVAWELGKDGKPIVLEGDQQSAGTKLSGYLDVQGYFFPERFPAVFTYGGLRRDGASSYDVVAVAREGLPSINLWFERSSHLLKRLTGQLGSNRIRGDIFSYQQVASLPIVRSALQTMTTPHGVHTESQNVVVYEFKPVAPARLSIPQ